MTGPIALYRRMLSDRRGSVAIEFGLLAPVAIGLMLGVLQVGVAMQSYNAIRNVSADVARHVAIEAQVSNHLSDTQIQQYAISTAVNSPYLLQAEGISVSVADASTQRVSNATEKTLTLSYEVPSILTLLGYSSPSISFTRPVFTAT